jgi:hypothetical protein
MKRISTAELLHIWDDCYQLPVIEKSLYLLSVIYGTDLNTVSRMTIGERDAGLLSFRKWLFGSRLINLAVCPKCSASMEWETNIEDITLQEFHPEQAAKILKLESDGFKIDFRLPNSSDVINAMANQGLSADISKFIAGCILEIQKGQKTIAPEALPADLFGKIEQIMSETDPQADVTMLLSCPDCEEKWEASFDIMNYLWLEIDNWAKRLMQEVAILAKNFNWSESAILNLSLHKRRLYLEMVS